MKSDDLDVEWSIPDLQSSSLFKGTEHDDLMTMVAPESTINIPQQQLAQPAIDGRPFVSFADRQRELYAARVQSRNNRILSSTNLEPIPQTPIPDAYITPQPIDPFESIPPLDQISLEPAKSKGVYAWSPHRGPRGCKLIIYLTHTSQLVKDIFSLSPVIYWLSFEGKLLPTARYQYTNQDLVDAHRGFGPQRKILLALIPSFRKKRVNLSLYTQSADSVITKIPLGMFEYDESGTIPFLMMLIVVPLRTYPEARRGGQELDVFLRTQEFHLEEIKTPRLYLPSEVTNRFQLRRLSSF